MNSQEQEVTETFVAPYLPQEAKDKIRVWEMNGKIAVQRIVPNSSSAKCKNCQDHGVVYVSFLGKGPTKAPLTTKKPSTYLEGNGRVGEGWYIVDTTVGYICPHCDGNPEALPPAEEFKPEAVEELRELAQDKAVSWQDW